MNLGKYLGIEKLSDSGKRATYKVRFLSSAIGIILIPLVILIIAFILFNFAFLNKEVIIELVKYLIFFAVIWFILGAILFQIFFKDFLLASWKGWTVNYRITDRYSYIAVIDKRSANGIFYGKNSIYFKNKS